MSNFKVGEIVYLKSGSPAMTVKETGNVDNEDYVVCTWFEGSKKFQDEFIAEQLTNKDPKFIPPSSAITTG